MLIDGVSVTGFLSFKDFDLSVPDRLLTITGPNGAGKSNVGRALGLLDGVVELAATAEEPERLRLHRESGFEGAGQFTVSAEIRFEQPWERDLILDFVHLAIATDAVTTRVDGALADVDNDVVAALTAGSADPLMSGRLIAIHDSSWRSPWSLIWEFDGPAGRYELILGPAGADTLTRHHQEFLFEGISGGPGLASRLGIQPGPGGQRPTWTGPLNFGAALPESGQSFTFRGLLQADIVIPASARALVSAGVGGELVPGRASNIGFAAVLHVLLRGSLLLAAGPRTVWRHAVPPGELTRPADPADGGALPATLFRLKNSGAVADKARWRRIIETFRQLTDAHLGVSLTVGDLGSGELLIRPTLVRDGRTDLPVELAGAGTEESLTLSVALSAPEGTVLLLDEPAMNLSATRQRRLLSLLRRRTGQTILITHNPALVPTTDGTVTRLVNDPTEGTVVRGRLDTSGRSKADRYASSTDVRNLLFARGVVLCEGPTEVDLLERWWETELEEDEFVLVSVGGDRSFAGWIDLVREMGLPWAVVCDGPALRPGTGPVAKLLRISATDNFDEARAAAEKAGAFTFADRFGDDGTKTGEIEEFLRQVDATAYAEIASDRPGKVRVGRAFAARVPRPPQAERIYSLVRERLIPLPAGSQPGPEVPGGRG